MIEVKVAAARRRCTLRQFFEQALRREAHIGPPKPKRPRPFKWHTYPGGLAPGFDVANRERMYEWFARELGEK